MIKKIMIYLILFSTLYGNFEVAPQIQRINLDRPTTRKIYLKNGTDKLKKIKVYSQVPENQKDKSLYMGDWIIVYPKIVYLKPNGKKVLRMAARPPQGLKDGEYRSYLVFEELPTKKNTGEGDNNKVGVNIEVLYKLISTVYGYKGNLIYDGTIKDLKIVKSEKDSILESKVINAGTTALDTFYKITYYKGVKKLKEENIHVGKVMRENTLDSRIKLNKNIKDATNIKIELYYKITKESKGREDTIEEIKLEEKVFLVEDLLKAKEIKTDEKLKTTEKVEVEDK
jgi:P pilus assembly chaperone PapD